MTNPAIQLPAWLLNWLPARVARRHVSQCASALPDSAEPTRQLLVDVSVIHRSDVRTGIQRVVRSLLLKLLQTPPAGYRVCPVFATRKHGYCHARPGFLAQPEQVPQGMGMHVQAQRGDIFLGLDLAAHLLPRHQAQVLRWKRSGVSVHVLVYDLLPLQHPEWFNRKTTANFKRWIKWLAVYADSAICISATVQSELADWLSAKFGLPAGTVPATRITLGADIASSTPSVGLPPDAKWLLARMRNTPAVLMVGTLEPRKGHDHALAAIEHIWQQTGGPAPLFVIVGRPGWKTEALQEQLRRHPQAGKRIFWLENASDELLECLYAACRGVVVASRAEGFGLPLIEAARHGKPVLARDLPVFREINLPHISYFHGDAPETLASALLPWLQPLTTEAAWSPAPTVFSWDMAAEQLVMALGLPRRSAQRNDAGAGTSSAAQGAFE